MRLEAQRIIGDWLKHASYGINQYIPTVPRDGGDPQPPLIATWNTTDLAIFNETEHVWVAERKDPPAVPCIYIMVEGPVEVEGEATPDGQIRTTTSPLTVVARYITANTDTVVAMRDAEYTLRALVRSLRELMKNANRASRVRNSIALEASLDPLVYFPVVEAVGQFRVTGAVGMNIEARDASPTF